MNLYQIKSLPTAFFWHRHFLYNFFLILAAISFLKNFPLRLHSWPAFPDATPDLLLKRASQRNSLKVIPSFCSYTISTFFFPLPLFRFLPLFLFLCLNLLPLMSRSRESQARKKGRGLTEIDVWALPLIRWLNPSINMQRRCPMQMDPIRRNGVVLSVRCGERWS